MVLGETGTGSFDPQGAGTHSFRTACLKRPKADVPPGSAL